MSDEFRASSSLSPIGPSAASRTPPLLGMSVAMVCLLGLPVVAHASYIAPNLAAGSNYRLIFVTADTIQATSSNEATYNNFANSEAALNSSLPSTTWSAITSTEATSAITNIDAVCTTSACLNAPIYLVDATTLIATNQAALFSGLLKTAIYETQSGATSNPYYVWTGSTSSGEIATGNAMGDSGPSVGLPSATNGTGQHPSIFSGSNFGASFANPIYAISGVLTVPASVPEPASAALLLTGLAGTGLVLRRRKQRPAASLGGA
ncbi:MAG: VPLPA-CTERM sorting domain-containing protein [Rhodospirillales bacterium]|nr:VPLPA-CTERM sorting domain-containing protein [Rhodospirillales bacterium]